MRMAGVLITFIALLCGTPALARSEVPQRALTRASISSAPMTFTRNEGQWPDSVLFRADAGGAVIWFMADGIYYQFTRRVPRDGATATASSSNSPGPQSGLDLLRGGPKPASPRRVADSVETILVKAEFVGANRSARVVGDGLMDYRCNYFFGNDPAKWHTDVPNYGGVTMHDVYPGVDLHFEGNSRGNLTYRYDLSPEAEVSKIRLTYKGAGTVSTDAQGRAVLDTKFGEVTGVLAAPNSDTQTLSSTRPGDSQPALLSSGGGAVPDAQMVPLVYSTYLGRSSNDVGAAIAVDDSGYAYVTGHTESPYFPTQNALDTTLGGIDDAFVTKLSLAGNSLVYSTYLGGSGIDTAAGIAVDDSGYAYVTGYTESSDFPTQNPFQAALAGFSDAFVTKLSSAGNSLMYSTYLGGSEYEVGAGVAVDDSGYAYVTGATSSSDFPTHTAFDAVSDSVDAFVTKLSAAGNSLVYSTYLGGSGYDVGQRIAVDSAGQVYATGWTNSSDFPKLNAFDGAYPATGTPVVFVTKFTASGNSLAYSTYLGGSNGDEPFGIAVDDAGSAYVSGVTHSSDFPTQNAFKDSLGALDNAFVTKFSAAGNSLVYSTYLGGSNGDGGYGIALDHAGNAYVTGAAYSLDFPTKDAFQAVNAGQFDAFVTELSSSGDSLVYSTYLGGSDFEWGNAIAVDGDGYAYVTGLTESSDFPTQNAFQADFGGSEDAFVAKLGYGSIPICCSLRGDLNNDGAINVADLTFLVSYLFQGGPAPKCIGNADVDGSGAINVSDLTYLVAYIFKGGAAPVPCQ